MGGSLIATDGESVFFRVRPAVFLIFAAMGLYKWVPMDLDGFWMSFAFGAYGSFCFVATLALMVDLILLALRWIGWHVHEKRFMSR